MAKGADIAKAISIALPLVAAFTKEAESSVASSEEKHRAVSSAVEQSYKILQGSIKEIRDIPWEVIAPLVLPVGGGIISIVVGLFNRLGVFLKGVISSHG